jgi:hypothetical protein
MVKSKFSAVARLEVSIYSWDVLRHDLFGGRFRLEKLDPRVIQEAVTVYRELVDPCGLYRALKVWSMLRL